MSNKSKEVTQFLDDQNHPFRKEIEQLRNCILAANANLTENIKWNGPNYCFENEDRITMKIQPPKQLQLIFHTGAKVKVQPKDRLINKGFGMLDWKGNDRAIATFRNMQDIEIGKAALIQIVSEWIIAAR